MRFLTKQESHFSIKKETGFLSGKLIVSQGSCSFLFYYLIFFTQSNSPLFDEAQYIVTCDHAITANDVQIKWTTLMGSTEASEKDEIGLAHVSISKDGEVFNEKTISFVAKAVNAVTDVIG